MRRLLSGPYVADGSAPLNRLRGNSVLPIFTKGDRNLFLSRFNYALKLSKFSK